MPVSRGRRPLAAAHMQPRPPGAAHSERKLGLQAERERQTPFLTGCMNAAAGQRIPLLC
jgi:hypothetical protein